MGKFSLRWEGGELEGARQASDGGRELEWGGVRELVGEGGQAARVVCEAGPRNARSMPGPGRRAGSSRRAESAGKLLWAS